MRPHGFDISGRKVNYSFLRIWSHLLKRPLMENFIFCAVLEYEIVFNSMVH